MLVITRRYQRVQPVFDLKKRSRTFQGAEDIPALRPAVGVGQVPYGEQELGAQAQHFGHHTWAQQGPTRPNKAQQGSTYVTLRGIFLGISMVRYTWDFFGSTDVIFVGFSWNDDFRISMLISWDFRRIFVATLMGFSWDFPGNLMVRYMGFSWGF